MEAAFLFNGIGGLVVAGGSNGSRGRGGEQWQWRWWVVAMEVTVEFPTKRCLWHNTNSLNSDLTRGALEDAYHFGV